MGTSGRNCAIGAILVGPKNCRPDGIVPTAGNHLQRVNHSNQHHVRSVAAQRLCATVTAKVPQLEGSVVAAGYHFLIANRSNCSHQGCVLGLGRSAFAGGSHGLMGQLLRNGGFPNGFPHKYDLDTTIGPWLGWGE